MRDLIVIAEIVLELGFLCHFEIFLDVLPHLVEVESFFFGQFYHAFPSAVGSLPYYHAPQRTST